MPIPSQYLLILDTDKPDSRLTQYFTDFNFAITHFQDYQTLLSTTLIPAVILINWQCLPKEASQQLKTLAARFSVPMIMISNESNPEAAISLLENGADDFLIKPLNPRELHARIAAINRRIKNITKKQSSDKVALTFHNWHLYPASHQLFNDKNEEISLSISEYNLLLAFLRQPQQILDREFLLQVTKNCDLSPQDRRIDIQISRLRQKIELNSKKPLFIKTIRNKGYLFTAQVSYD